MTDRLSPQREAEIAAAVAELDADRTLVAGTWTASPVDEKSVFPPELAYVVEDVLHTPSDATIRMSVGVFGDERHAAFTALTRTAVGELLAELAAVRAEREELTARARRVAVSHEHFIWDHSDPGAEALAAQYELVNYLSGMPGETELPLNPVENALRLVLALLDQYDENVTPGEIRKTLAEFLPREDMSDRRRRIYIDGKGDAWIDLTVDPVTGDHDVTGITNPWKIASADEVRTDTGSLREIGRCW